MNTLENNKLIAEFMGGKLIFPSTCNYGVFEFSKKDKYILTHGVEPTTENGIAQHLLKFNTSWDWLMKVVDKIESIVLEEVNDTSFNITIGATIYCVIQDNNGGIIEIEGKGKTKIEAVYTACVEFIKWYNKQKATV